MSTARLKSLPDDILISTIREGDSRAFRELVRRYEATVYRFAYRLCRDRERAEETFQDTFINVFRKLKSFDGRSKFSTWLYSIAANSCLMKHRQRKSRAREVSLDELDHPAVLPDGHFAREVARWERTPEEFLLDKELRGKVEEAIGKLPGDYRIVFVLRDLEGRSTAETASIAGISEEAVKSRLRRARAFLRGELDPYMSDGGGSRS